MNCRKIILKDFNVMSPVIPDGVSFEQTLFYPDENWEPNEQFNIKKVVKPVAKEVRRMNRIASMAYVSSTSIMDKIDFSGINNYRFGAIFSTHNASYENVLRILKNLYGKGAEAVSPIDFSYSVGNSLLSGITIKYGLKGPCTVLPSSDPLLLTRIILQNGEADYMLVGSFNICLDENLEFYRTLDYLNGDRDGFTKLLEEANGAVVREVGISMILESSEHCENKDEKKCYLSGFSDIRAKLHNVAKKDLTFNNYPISTDAELSMFSAEDFKKSMKIAMADAKVTAEDIDAVFTCTCGNKSLDLEEYKAIVDTFNENTELVSIQSVFGTNLGGNFMLNSAAAASSLKNQCLPPTKGISEGNSRFNKEKKSKKLTTILVNGYNDTGNIISGVWQWM